MWWSSAVNFSFFLALRLSAHGPVPGTRFPGSVPGACVAGPCSPWSPPFAPPPPLPVSRLCSPASSLLWRGLTSHARASSATAPRLPDADQRRQAALARQEISRFPHKERLHMPGSQTTQGRSGARNSAPARLAFRQQNGVGAQKKAISRLNGWPIRSPTDASPMPSRTPAHGSGPMWFATPSS